MSKLVNSKYLSTLSLSFTLILILLVSSILSNPITLSIICSTPAPTTTRFSTSLVVRLDIIKSEGIFTASHLGIARIIDLLHSVLYHEA